MVDPIQDVIDFGGYFTEAMFVDPISAVLILLSALLMVVAVGAFGILALLGIIDWLRPEPSPAPARHG